MKNNKSSIQSLYIHIPFCESICDYCDFTKLQYFHNFAVKYIDVLKQEILNLHLDHKMKTIFIGGGTPTSLEDDLFEDLLSFVSIYADENCEFSIESNPESLSLNKIKILKKYKVNRVSIGVESTNNKILKSINRNHTFEDVKKVVECLKENGINNINVDLILGLPNVSETLLNKDIENILLLDVNHVSCYGLTVHEHTVFFNKNIEPPIDDELRKMYDLVNTKLENSGYVHYEVSNWCKPGHECKHNLTYWNDEQYYGVGLGASGYVNNIRYTNTKILTKYFDNYLEKDFEETINKSDDKTYYIMLKLRTIFGINLDEYRGYFEEDLYEINKTYIENCIKQGLLSKKDNILAPTYEGMMVLDQIILQLID